MIDLAYIPSPSISSFQIGAVTIRFYALMILIGICVDVWLTSMRWKKVGGNFDQILDITIVAVPTGIIGARLYHVITTPELYFGSSGHFIDIFKIWNGGLGIWGAVFVGGLCVWAWCRHAKYPVTLLMDAVAPGLLIAQAIGRLGNWFNQELYGAPTTLPWGLKLNDSAYAIGSSEVCYDGTTCPTGTLFHPTFLYEMLWNLAGAALLLSLGKLITKRFKAGSQFALYVMWYTAGRAWIEALRIDFSHNILGLRVNIWVSLVCFVLAVVAFVLLQREGSAQSILAKRLARVTELELEVTQGKMTSRQLRTKLSEEARLWKPLKTDNADSENISAATHDSFSQSKDTDTTTVDAHAVYEQAKASVLGAPARESSKFENTDND